MGLDMYLHGKEYVRGEGITTPSGKEATYMHYEAAYWRKSNAIHGWFVKNVQGGEDDCKDYYVSIAQLQKLLDTCNEVLKDHTKAMDLLPPCSGFFFGSAEIDENYWYGINTTIEQLGVVLAENDPSGHVWHYYSSSW